MTDSHWFVGLQHLAMAVRFLVDDHFDKNWFLVDTDLDKSHLDIVVDHRSKDRIGVVLFVDGCEVFLMGCLRLQVYCLKTGPII